LTTELAEVIDAPRPLARVDEPVEITKLLQLAVERDLPVEKMERLIALHERISDRHAAMEFGRAMAEFQEHCPPIPRTSQANIVTKSGVKFSYKYAELDEIARTIGPFLHAKGLSYTWDSTVSGGILTCTCTLRHVNGHKVTALFSAPTSSDAGMSESQKVASALTFARRQSLTQVLGLTCCDPDDDGAARGAPEATITEEQSRTILDLLIEVNRTPEKFARIYGVEKVSEIPASMFEAAVNVLTGQQAKGKA